MYLIWDCDIATTNARTINKGPRSPMKWKILFRNSIVQANPLKIFTELWSAIILANKRILELNARKQWEISSRSTKKGAKGSGTPASNKKLKKLSPCLWNPTIVVPIKMDNERAKVIRKWLVTVKLKGIIPWGLRNNEKIKVTEKQGKNFCFTFPERQPICSFTRFGTKS
jgi:hypothetical protein